MRKVLVIITATLVAFAVGFYMMDWGASSGKSRLLATFAQEEAYEPLVDANGATSKGAVMRSGYEKEDVLVMLYSLAIVATMWRLWSKEQEASSDARGFF
ncbi:hypothetical protein IK110_03900 [Candidatus Saccharibacteria bacterium]|nr:hypothetical protein [Candidatus Saccharibacteria bacterium]